MTQTAFVFLVVAGILVYLEHSGEDLNMRIFAWSILTLIFTGVIVSAFLAGAVGFGIVAIIFQFLRIPYLIQLVLKRRESNALHSNQRKDQETPEA